MRASFAGRENKAFSLGEKTRASFTARDSRASLTAPRRNVSEEVRMRNLEVMAEYEGTRTYRSAVSSEYQLIVKAEEGITLVEVFLNDLCTMTTDICIDLIKTCFWIKVEG